MSATTTPAGRCICGNRLGYLSGRMVHVDASGNYVFHPHVPEQVCTCGHGYARHRAGRHIVCWADDCDCVTFNPGVEIPIPRVGAPQETQEV